MCVAVRYEFPDTKLPQTSTYNPGITSEELLRDISTITKAAAMIADLISKQPLSQRPATSTHAETQQPNSSSIAARQGQELTSSSFKAITQPVRRLFSSNAPAQSQDPHEVLQHMVSSFEKWPNPKPSEMSTIKKIAARAFVVLNWAIAPVCWRVTTANYEAQQDRTLINTLCSLLWDLLEGHMLNMDTDMTEMLGHGLTSVLVAYAWTKHDVLLKLALVMLNRMPRQDYLASLVRLQKQTIAADCLGILCEAPSKPYKHHCAVLLCIAFLAFPFVACVSHLSHHACIPALYVYRYLQKLLGLISSSCSDAHLHDCL